MKNRKNRVVRLLPMRKPINYLIDMLPSRSPEEIKQEIDDFIHGRGNNLLMIHQPVPEFRNPPRRYAH